jgi:Ca2+-binding EF-hand superfamily protein
MSLPRPTYGFTLASTSLVAAALIALAAGPTLAAPNSPALQAMIARADANHDGWLTFGEFQAARLSMFARADANNDGQMVMSEARAMRTALGLPRRNPGPKAMATLHAVDPNGDMKVTRAEFTAAGRARFTALDQDQDGRLAAGDVLAALSE